MRAKRGFVTAAQSMIGSMFGKSSEALVQRTVIAKNREYKSKIIVMIATKIDSNYSEETQTWSLQSLHTFVFVLQRAKLISVSHDV